jgi:hypothetical protein
MFVALILVSSFVRYDWHMIESFSKEKIYKNTEGVLMVTKGGQTAWVVFISKGGKARPIKAEICMSVPKCKSLVSSLLEQSRVKVLEVDEPSDDDGSPPVIPEEDHKNSSDDSV